MPNTSTLFNTIRDFRASRLPCGMPHQWEYPRQLASHRLGIPALNGRLVNPRLPNWGPISMVLLYLLAANVAFGIAVALAFVAVGVEQVQPKPVTVGARILLLPGAFV